MQTTLSSTTLTMPKGAHTADSSCSTRFVTSCIDDRYYRKAKAQQLLAQTSGAIDTLTSALSKANLAGEKGLNDALVEAYGGFPQTVRICCHSSHVYRWLTNLT